MPAEKVDFPNAKGGQLAAMLELPVDRQPLAYAIFAHCFTCTKNLKAAVRISRALAQEGIAVLRFDFTGLGDSDGDFSETNFSSNVTDIQRAAAFLEQHYRAPVLLIGHSLGGAAVLQAAAKIDSVRAVISVAAPADPAHLLRHFSQHKKTIEQFGEAEVSLDGRVFKIKRQLLNDLQQNPLEETLQKLKKALLVMHSPLDKSVAIEHAARIFTAAKHPKSFISLDTADHLLTAEQDAVYAGKMAASWACRFLGVERADPDVDVAENQVVAKIEKGFQTEIVANGHSLVADEPIAVGGTNTGPSPYDLLVAGLGACTAMTLRMYADRKKLPLESVSVILSHKKIHAQDCDGCETDSGKVDRIEREIKIRGDLSATERERLMAIADRCPVHKTLHSEVHIATRQIE